MITKTRKRIYNKHLTVTEQKIIGVKMIIELYVYHKPKKARRKMIKKAGFMVFYKLMEKICKRQINDMPPANVYVENERT